MLFPHEEIYTYEKLYFFAALLPAIILTVMILAYIFCSYLERAHKKALLLLTGVILALQMSQFLTAVSPPRELPFFLALWGAAFSLWGGLFFRLSFLFLEKKSLKPSVSAALFLLPLTGLALALTNEYHFFFYKKEGLLTFHYGSAYYSMAFYNFLCSLAALFLALKFILQKKSRAANKGFALPTAAAAALFLAFLLLDLFLTQPFGLISGPLFLAAALLVLTLAILPLKHFYSPLTLRLNMLESLKESVFLADHRGDIFYFNPTPENLFLGLEMGKNIADLKETPFAEKTSLLLRKGSARGEFALLMPERKFFSYYAQPIQKGEKSPRAILCSFTDITDHKELFLQLERKNQELHETARKLKRHTAVVKQLSEEKEKNRVLQQIQETVGDCLRRIIHNLETTPPEAVGDVEAEAAIIQESIDYARKGLQDIRRSVSQLSSQKSLKGEPGDGKSFNS